MAQRSIVLAISADNAEALLDGKRRHLGEPERKTDKGWALPVSGPRRYRTPRPIAELGLTKVPRSFRYVEK